MASIAVRARRILPRPLLRAVTQSKNIVLDVFDTVRGRRPDLVPPRRLSFVGAGDFTAIGLEFLRYFQDLGGLRPTDHVLDVGCGIGRMALPLTGYLSKWLGRRRLLMLSITVFTLSSALCGMAWNLESMVFFRLRRQTLAHGGHLRVQPRAPRPTRSSTERC